jgi:uncharacterized protein
MEPAILDSIQQLPVDEILRRRFGVEMGQVVALCERFGIVELGVFGSAVRDDFRAGGEDPSDVDLLLVLDEAVRRSRSYRDSLDLQAALEELFGREVDICQKILLKNPYRRAEILETVRMVYASK